jgi:hypothetical protein
MENCWGVCSCEVAAGAPSFRLGCEAIEWLIDLYWEASAKAGTSGKGAFATDLFPAGMSKGRGPIGAFAFGIEDCLLLLVKLDLWVASLASLFAN